PSVLVGTGHGKNDHIGFPALNGVDRVAFDFQMRKRMSRPVNLSSHELYLGRVTAQQLNAYLFVVRVVNSLLEFAQKVENLIDLQRVDVALICTLLASLRQIACGDPGHCLAGYGDESRVKGTFFTLDFTIVETLTD